MDKPFRHSLPKVLLAFCLAMTLAASGRTAPGPMAADPLAIAFLQAGGTLAELCDDGGRSPAHHGQHPCADCTLPGQAALQDPGAVAAPRFAALAGTARAWPALPGLPPRRAHPGWSGRAPPLA